MPSRRSVRERCAIFAVLATLGFAHPLRAEQPPRVDVSALLAYGFPAGNLERGSRLSDVTFGAADLELSGAYRVSQRWSAGLALNHAVTIPTLCVTRDDCIGSLGRDTRLGMLGRWRPLSWRRIEPHAEFQFGYEWLKTKLVDSEVSSARGYRGPYIALAMSAQYLLGRHFSLGPTLAASAGAFQRVSLSAPGIDASRGTDGPELHVWWMAGVRALIVL